MNWQVWRAFYIFSLKQIQYLDLFTAKRERDSVLQTEACSAWISTSRPDSPCHAWSYRKSWGGWSLMSSVFGSQKPFSAKQRPEYICKKSRNVDTLGPVELILWLEQGNQGDRCEQDDQGEVSIIIFGLSKSSGFQKYSICWVFQALCLCLCLCRCLCHCLCLCICVILWFLNSFHHKLSE